MTLFEWAERYGVRLSPPNDKGLVIIPELELYSPEANAELKYLIDYEVQARSASAAWLKPIPPTGARSGTGKKK